MSIETMKQALEALEYDTRPETEYGINSAITTLRQAIEAAEKQEPDELTIAYMSGFYDGKNKYAPRREWVGLTDEEAAECWNSSAVTTWKNIEAKLREKNKC